MGRHETVTEEPLGVTSVIEAISDRGSVRDPGILVDDKRFIVQGQFLTIARLRDEWYDELGDPEAVIAALGKYEPRPDLFTFWQRLPDLAPIYSYHCESEALSAIPLTTFEHWWEKQIKTDTRKKIKRPEKRGVEIKVVSLNDDFVRGVMEIFNETPVRRGRRFSHYGKSFETLKEMLCKDLAISKFIGAYH